MLRDAPFTHLRKRVQTRFECGKKPVAICPTPGAESSRQSVDNVLHARFDALLGGVEHVPHLIAANDAAQIQRASLFEDVARGLSRALSALPRSDDAQKRSFVEDFAGELRRMPFDLVQSWATLGGTAIMMFDAGTRNELFGNLTKVVDQNWSNLDDKILADVQEKPGKFFARLIALLGPVALDKIAAGEAGEAVAVALTKSTPTKTWNPERMAELGDAKSKKIVAALSDETYVGPAMESAVAVESFVNETIHHAYRVMDVTKRVIGGRYRTHDLVERVPVSEAALLAVKLRGKAAPSIEVSWLDALIAKAVGEGQTELEVGKFAPYIAAGLGRVERPDPVAVALHRLSGHHRIWKTREEIVEAMADILDALVIPRRHEVGMSYQAAEKIFWDMADKGLISLADTPAARTLFSDVASMHETLADTVWKQS
jgi:hypothetical protein